MRIAHVRLYYFHSEAMPLYLLTLFAKNEQANLTHAERNALAGQVDTLVSGLSGISRGALH